MSRYIFTVLMICLLSSVSIGQNRGQIKVYDTTKAIHTNKKAKTKKLTGNIDSTSFTLTAWADSLGENPECSFYVDLLSELTPFIDYYNAEPTATGTKYICGSPLFQYTMFITESGNFEWEVILNEKIPGNRNSVTFPIQTEGLTFHYQDTLTDEEVARGCWRPDSVVGSYAVYHSTKSGNYYRLDGTSDIHKTGKALHIYRPKAWDANHDTVWCVLGIDTIADTLGVSIDKTWLKNATYPVVIDPVFGPTSVGASGTGLEAYKYANNIDAYTASTGDVLDSINAAVHSYAEPNPTFTMACYETGATVPGDRVTDSFTVTVTEGGTGTFYGYDCNFAFTNATEYQVAAGNATDVTSLRYDSDGSGSGEMCTTDGKLDDPWGCSNNNISARLSIYGTYTEAEGEEPSTRRRKVILGGN